MSAQLPAENDESKVKKSPLDIQDYLDASSEASLRARTVSFLIVVASIVVFAGLLNSLQSSWMLTRIQIFNNRSNDYVTRKIGHEPPKTDKEGKPSKEYDEYLRRYEAFYTAYARSYVENTFFIRVPFFGFAFDVNDLGLLGGLALLILVTILRFCLSREINNLDLSFSEASRISQLRELYFLLAMRQVLTIPQTTLDRPKGFLIAVPKVLCFLPLIVHAAVTVHDVLTTGLFNASLHAMIVVVNDIVILVALGIVTFMVIKRLMRIDLIWSRCWKAIEKGSDYPPDRNDRRPLLNAWRDQFAGKALKSDCDVPIEVATSA